MVTTLLRGVLHGAVRRSPGTDWWQVSGSGTVQGRTTSYNKSLLRHVFHHFVLREMRNETRFVDGARIGIGHNLDRMSIRNRINCSICRQQCARFRYVGVYAG